MYQLIQRRDLSASHTPLLLIVIVTTLLTIPGFAWPSEDPAHSSQYDQLKDSITALSGEVNSIASIIGTLKEQARTPQTAPQGYDHLRKTIQDLTKTITGLTRVIDSLAQNISKEKPQDLNNAGTLQPAIANLSANVTLLAANVALLTTQVATIHGANTDQESDSHKILFMAVGAVFTLVATLVIVILRWVLFDKPKQEKERAKEKLEKFYAPVLGRLQANEDIWKNFTSEGSIANEGERNRITAANSSETKASETQDKKKEAFEIAENILKDILNHNGGSRRQERLDVWVHAMEGIFRQNNEAAEKTILENCGYLRPGDVDKDSDFDKERKKYLMHVGEFKAVLHRWEETKTDPRYQNDNTWYGRCCRSYNLDTKSNHSFKLSDEKFLNYFHPTNPYRKEFLDEVLKSYDELMEDAGLRKKSSLGRWLRGGFKNWLRT